MKTRYIKGTKKRYSINELGEVFSHYRNNNQGNRIDSYRQLTPCFNIHKSKITPNNSPCVTLHFPDKKACKFIKTLMIDHFNLTPPDNNHDYVLSPIDGNNLNNSIKNLEWVIRTLREWNYQPKAFSKKGVVVSKICGECGENRTINSFTFSSAPHQPSKGKVKKYCYRNMCEMCRSLIQINQINADPVKFEKLKQRQKEWTNSEAGKKYYKKYKKMYNKKKSVELLDCYVRQQAKKRGISYEIMDDTVVEMLRLQIKIKRELKEK